MKLRFQYFYKFFGMFIPDLVMERIAQELRYAGIEKDHRLWVGKAIMVSLIMALIAMLIPVAVSTNVEMVKQLGEQTGVLPLLRELINSGWVPDVLSQLKKDPNTVFFSTSLVWGVGVFVITLFLHYLYVFYLKMDRTDRIESYLLDFLYLLVSNLNSGMTPYDAFIGAAKKEFGPLSEEIMRASAKAIGSQSLTEALKEMTKNINSDLFNYVVKLYEKGIKSGGNVAPLLMACADEIRWIQALRRKMIVSVRGYLIFLAFIIIFIAPTLFSIGKAFLTVFIQLKSDLPDFQHLGLPIDLFSGKIEIQPRELQQLILIFLFADSLSVSVFIGVLQRGSVKYGLRYFPIIFALTALSFYVSGKLIKDIFVF